MCPPTAPACLTGHAADPSERTHLVRITQTGKRELFGWRGRHNATDPDQRDVWGHGKKVLNRVTQTMPHSAWGVEFVRR